MGFNAPRFLTDWIKGIMDGVRRPARALTVNPRLRPTTNRFSFPRPYDAKLLASAFRRQISSPTHFPPFASVPSARSHRRDRMLQRNGMCSIVADEDRRVE